MKYAEQRIREASRRLEALDRALAELPQQLPDLPYNHPLARELRAESHRLGVERNKAYRELLELLELDEMPIDEMGHA